MKKYILAAMLSPLCSGLVSAESESNLGFEIAPIGDTYLAVVIRRPNMEFMVGFSNFLGENSSNRIRLNSTGTYTEYSSTKHFELVPLINARYFINNNIFVMAGFETLIYNDSLQYNADLSDENNVVEDFTGYSIKGGIGVIFPVLTNVSIVTQSGIERSDVTYSSVDSDNNTADVTADYEDTGVYYSVSYSLAIQYNF